jgi:hypothetical protein
MPPPAGVAAANAALIGAVALKSCTPQSSRSVLHEKPVAPKCCTLNTLPLAGWPAHVAGLLATTVTVLKFGIAAGPKANVEAFVKARSASVQLITPPQATSAR